MVLSPLVGVADIYAAEQQGSESALRGVRMLQDKLREAVVCSRAPEGCVQQGMPSVVV